MNNFRLSTYSGSVEILSLNEKEKLINTAPTIEHLNDGRQRDINTNKIIHQNTSCIYEIYKSNGEVLLMQTLSEVAETIDVNIKTISKHLDVLDSNGIVLKGYKIKRIPVFYPKLCKD